MSIQTQVTTICKLCDKAMDNALSIKQRSEELEALTNDYPPRSDYLWIKGNMQNSPTLWCRMTYYVDNNFTTYVDIHTVKKNKYYKFETSCHASEGLEGISSISEILNLERELRNGNFIFDIDQIRRLCDIIAKPLIPSTYFAAINEVTKIIQIDKIFK